MSQEIFWILLSKKLSGEASPEELVVLQNLILEHPEWQYAIQNLEDLWKHEAPKDNTQEEEDAYLLHLQRMQEMNIPIGHLPVAAAMIPFEPRKRTLKWYWAAAVIAIVMLSGWILLANPFNRKENGETARQVNEITTRPGSTSKVELPDGSIVWLNAGSKLTYNKDFNKELREVTLSGEGYFDVMKMKDKPFIIHTNRINIKVLGTAFNVKAYPEDKKTETSLIRGSIEVTIRNRPNNKIILSPNEKLVVENDKLTRPIRTAGDEPLEVTTSAQPLVSLNKIHYSPVDSTVAETAWMDNKLVFRDESFEELAIRMERRYDVKIEIGNEELRNERLNGTFDSESVNQALEALVEMIPFKYERNGNQIIINR